MHEIDTKKCQDHIGAIIRKHRDFWGRHLITIEAVGKKVPLIVSRALYDSRPCLKNRFGSEKGRK